MTVLATVAIVSGAVLVKDMVAYCIDILRQPSGDFYEESED